jgi:hypothetical protein
MYVPPAGELGESLNKGTTRMDASTRPPPKRHRASLYLAACLVAVYFDVTSSLGAVNSQSDPLPAIKPLFLAPAAHDIGIESVKSGAEGLQLSARFSENGGELVRDVTWKIRTNSGGEVFNGITTTVDAVLTPNDYQVEAIYGTAHIVQDVSVQPGTRLTVNFVLNAGGLRVLPRVKNIGWPNMTNQSNVFLLSGTTRGQLVTTSFTPGEVLKLFAGDYRIESQFENSNVVAVTDVHVRPGIMSAVDINYIAGMARVSLGWLTQSTVSWTISDATSRISFEGANTAELVLKPGHYQVAASIAGLIYTTNFDLKIGQTIEVIISQK